MTMTTFFIYLNSVLFLCHLLAGKRDSLSEHSRPKFSFFVSLRFFLVGCTPEKVLLFALLSFVLVLLLFLGREEDSPLQHEDDDDVNENDDWICKNNDYCFHPDIIIVIVFVAKKKFKDHL